MFHFYLSGHCRIHGSSPARRKDKHHRQVAAQYAEATAVQPADQAAQQALMAPPVVLAAVQVAGRIAATVVVRAELPPLQCLPAGRSQDYPASAVHRCSLVHNLLPHQIQKLLLLDLP